MLRGGVADKLGNDYEAHWTLIEALRVLRGHAEEIRLEAFNEDATGFEFRVTSSGRNVWHQCKRRRANGSWTMHALATEGVLAAFGRKFSEAQNECVFVSSDPAAAFEALTEKARLVETGQDFSASLSSADISAVKQLRAVWDQNDEITYDWLRRCRVETVSDYSLLREARAVCSLTFKADPELAIDRLAAFLDTKLTQTVTTSEFRAAIDSLDLGWKAHLDETLDEKFSRATDEYLQSLQPPIAGTMIETDDIEEAVKLVVTGTTALVVIAGAAGSGKSVAMSRIIAAGRSLGWPTLAFRLDRFLSAQAIEEVGKALLGRAESPSGVLGNRYGTRETLLVVDQVDAVSEASGRSGRIRDQLFQMISDGQFFPHMRIAIACRSYDLEHDSRLKSLILLPHTQAVTLKPLDWDGAVHPVLDRLGLGGRRFSEHERRILNVPINLKVFANLSELGETVDGDLSGSRLFDQLLDVRAREFRQNGIAWTPQAALGAIARNMSSNQELIAPVNVLASFPGAVDTLGSAGLITAVGGKLQFAHESFFDHVFSSDFVSMGTSVHSLLVSDEQRLFRRTQIRQIFSRLRDQGNNRRYLANLEEVMSATDIRFLVKDAVAHWLRGVDEPTEQERAIVEKWYPPEHANTMLARTIFSGPDWLPILLNSGSISRWIEQGGGSKNFCLGLLQRGAVAHAGLVEPFLRAWWGNSDERLRALMGWFARLYPEGSIGPLEGLYRDLIAGFPVDGLNAERFDNSFDLHSWVHKNKDLGARVLGMWLARWMAAFPESHPFGDNVSDHSGYWMKELVEHAPMAFLNAVLPLFVEGWRREQVSLTAGHRHYPTIRVPLSDYDSRVVWSLIQAFENLAKADPIKVAAFLDALPTDGAPALLMHLRAIAANGEALARRLLPMLTCEGIFDIGEGGGGWAPFAMAAKVAFPFLSEDERYTIEAAIMSHRPELAWVKEHLTRVRNGHVSPSTADPNAYIRLQLKLTGQDERAILATIGAMQLSSAARVRLAELDRKFADRPLPEAYGIRGGVVQSPIDQEKAAQMTDRHWLSAMARYPNDRDHVYYHDYIIGGARELALVLQACTKENPERFVNLLEAMSLSINSNYAIAILRGIQESAGDGALAARAIRAANRWPEADCSLVINWTVQKHVGSAKDPMVLALVLTSAEFGSASDTIIQTVNPHQTPHKLIRDLLGSNRDYETSGLNGERGTAFGALAAVLWDNEDVFEVVVDLVERRVEVEPLTSVRMMMLRTINSIAKHDTSRGLRLLERLARRDPVSLRSNVGRHILNWATYNENFDANGIIELLLASPEPGQRALGLFMESGLALGDDLRAATFSNRFANDSLCRQVAAYRAISNVSSDRVGDRAATWLVLLFDDEDKDVRRETLHIAWNKIFSGKTDRADLALAHITSRSFEDHSDILMRSLEDHVDQFPEITFTAVQRTLDLVGNLDTADQNGHYFTLHRSGRILIELYRSVEGDSKRERDILDLFDNYLRSEAGNMRIEISAYERH